MSLLAFWCECMPTSRNGKTRENDKLLSGVFTQLFFWDTNYFSGIPNYFSGIPNCFLNQG